MGFTILEAPTAQGLGALVCLGAVEDFRIEGVEAKMVQALPLLSETAYAVALVLRLDECN